MSGLMEQRVMEVTAVDVIVTPGPPPDDIGLWKVTATSSTETVTLEVCDPPSVGAYLFLEVEAVQTVPPADRGDAF